MTYRIGRFCRHVSFVKPASPFQNPPRPAKLGDPSEEAEINKLLRMEKRKQLEALASEDANETRNTLMSDLQTDEIGGPKGKEPTRYGDWERNGRTSDF